MSDISFMFSQCYSLVEIIGAEKINNDLVDEKRHFLADCNSLSQKTCWDLEVTKIALEEVNFN